MLKHEKIGALISKLKIPTITTASNVIYIPFFTEQVANSLILSLNFPAFWFPCRPTNIIHIILP